MSDILLKIMINYTLQNVDILIYERTSHPISQIQNSWKNQGICDRNGIQLTPVVFFSPEN